MALAEQTKDRVLKRLRVSAAGCAVLIALTLVGLSACGSRLSEANVKKIELGMSRQQVVELIGKPDEVHETIALGLSGSTLSYHSHGLNVTVALINDKVISTTVKKDAP